MSKYISVGKILNFHGIKGEARVGFTKSQQDFFLGLDLVYVKKGNEYFPLKILANRINKNFAIVKFDGINTIDELLEYKGCLLFVDEKTIRDNLEEDEFLIDELVGLEVFDTENIKQGIVIGVSNNGATDLLSVKTKNGKISLIPFVNAIVPEVNIKSKKIIINNIEGLLD